MVVHHAILCCMKAELFCKRRKSTLKIILLALRNPEKPHQRKKCFFAVGDQGNKNASVCSVSAFETFTTSESGIVFQFKDKIPLFFAYWHDRKAVSFAQ